MADLGDMSEMMKYVGGTAGAVTLGAVSVAAMYYAATRPTPMDTGIDFNSQSQDIDEIPLAKTSILCDGGLIERYYEDVSTIYEAFHRGANISNGGRCLGYRPENESQYRWISYPEVLERAGRTGSGFVFKGLAANNDSRVGIYSQNRVEYVLSELACYTYSMTIVPLYDTLGPEACTYILNQAEISLVVCDKNEKVKNLLTQKENTPGLKTIVCMEVISDENKKLANEMGVDILTFAELETLGVENAVEPNPSHPDDLATICYTSGTTGMPKGAMITHKSIIAVVSGLQVTLEFLNAGPKDILISYLPLAHMYERICQVFLIVSGGQIGFYRGDVRKLLDDIAILKPTIFPTVPRLLNRIYDKVIASVSSSVIKKTLFDMAMASKTKEIERGIIRNNSIWDTLVFKKVQQSLGGRVKVICTGSAPLSARVMNFIRCAAGCTVVEGYGQTESAAVATLQLPGERAAGNVGPPLPSCMIKLVDVPEMQYHAAEGKGEVVIKGPIVFKGYLKAEEKTKEAIDVNGWLHTGDIGTWLPNGTLKIIDRKKHIFKLAQGEYIAPEKIENVYIRSEAVAQIFIHGDSLKASIIGIVVPDPETFKKWCIEKAGVSGTVEELSLNPAIKKAVLDHLTVVGKKSGLNSFEQVKDIYLHADPFSVENGLLTPTFKAKRQAIVERFSKEIDTMYSKLS